MWRSAAVLSAFLTATLTFFAAELRASDEAVARQAQAIFDATGVCGGLVVHLGCGDGRLTAALRAGENLVVHGLDADPARVASARQYLRSLGLYGPVSVQRWEGPRLPYVDNTVNLLVADVPGAVSSDEMMRVLVPGGVAYAKQGNRWTTQVKPPREGVDEWTHFLHDASGNPVAGDTVVGPPRHLQWTAGPEYGRSHEYTPSISAVVSTGGRVFYIVDEAPTESLWQHPVWKVLARDAYNGILLWERPIAKWFPHLCGWTQGPRQLQRKLVAVDDRVYVTLGYHAPLSVLDAATGEPVRVYDDTEGTEEILWHQGILLLVVRDVTAARRQQYAKWQDLTTQADSPLLRREPREPLVRAFRSTENQAPSTILALDAATGQILWKKSGADTAGLRPLCLRACGQHVYCQRQGGLHCFDLRSGETVWKSNAWTLHAVSDKAVVCATKEDVMVLSPDDGSLLWSHPLTLSDLRDVMLIGDSVWLGGGRPFDTGKKHTGSAWGPYFAVQRDVATGRVVKEITAKNPGHHHRCYENKATERYILGGRRGTEFLDLASGDYLWNSWARGTCRYGVMPCNGMLYTPPHACGCYITVKLTGFNALGPAEPDRSEPTPAPRLQHGPAYDTPIPHSAFRTPHSNGWPTYRGDTQRSACAKCAVPTALGPKWQSDVGAKITPPTAAGGRVFVARPDRHELIALDAASGKPAWTFTADGRIDSPPTLHNGRVLFGSHDGYVYCLRATDGALAWRLRAARRDEHIVADGQVESCWPVHGAVLVHDDTLALAAGRSSYLDGGIDLLRVNPATGDVLSQTSIYSPDPETGRQPQQYGPNGMPGARSDILAADDRYLYLRDLTFNHEGTEVDDRRAHLFTLTDFLDTTWTHRSYWIFGTKSSISTGCSGQNRNLLYGRLLALDDTTVYGYGRTKVHWSSEFEDGPYRVFARRRDADEPLWSVAVPMRVRALLLAGDELFIAGAGPTPGLAPQKQNVSPDPLLLAISTKDGSELSRRTLPAAPVFDGMAAAGGELLITLESGQVMCLAGK